MGLIHLEDMEFYGYHGCFREEQIVGNKFVVNLELETDMTKAADSDMIDDALNYQIAYRIVKEEMEVRSNLLEHIAKRILDKLHIELTTLNIAKVRISKMNPPMGGKMKSVSVTMSR